MGFYDGVDIDFTWDGDFYISESGDLADTSDDHLRSLENEVRSVLKSETGDWLNHPTIGANLSDFQGEPNTRGVGEAITKRVKSRLSSIQLIRPEDITVRTVPISQNTVMVLIRISATATPNNRLSVGELINISFLYDSIEDSVFFINESEIKRRFRSF